MPSYRDVQPPGFEITPELKTWDSTRRCPRCQLEIYVGEKDGFRIEACGRCGGVWLDDEQAKRALAVGSRAPEELAEKVEKVTRAVPQKSAERLPCPECGQPMKQESLGNATIDRCAHGTWFDRTELATVMRERRGEKLPELGSVETLYLKEQELRKQNMFGPELEAVREALGRLIDAFLA